MSPPMMHRDRSAFSMLELIISVTILGIVCAAAVPRLQASLEGQRLESLSRQFFSELQFCRSLAIRENRRIRFMPTTGTSSFRIRRINADGSILSTVTVNLSTTAQTLATIHSFSAPPNTYIEFNHLGEVSAPSGDLSALAAGSIAAVQFRSGGRTRTVQISPALSPLP